MFRPYQVRTKKGGKPVGGWRTVYALSEQDAARIDAVLQHGPGNWEVSRMKKKRRF